MQNICSVSVLFQDAPTNRRHIFFIYISLFQLPQFKKNWLRKLITIVLSVYFMVFLIFIMASHYQLYTFLNIALCLKLFIHRFTRWGLDGDKNRVSPQIR